MKLYPYGIKSQGRHFTMKKGLTEQVFKLNKCGSISGLETDTFGWYNSMHAKQVIGRTKNRDKCHYCISQPIAKIKT